MTKEFAGSRLVAFSNSLRAGSNRPMAASAANTARTLCTRASSGIKSDARCRCPTASVGLS